MTFIATVQEDSTSKQCTAFYGKVSSNYLPVASIGAPSLANHSYSARVQREFYCDIFIDVNTEHMYQVKSLMTTMYEVINPYCDNLPCLRAYSK